MGKTQAERAREYRQRKRNSGILPKNSNLTGVFLEKKGRVYVAASDGFVKIGITYRDVSDRIRAMQTGNPHSISLLWSISHINPESAEARLHALFEPKRIRGEWFQLDMTDRMRLLEALALEKGISRQIEKQQDMLRIDAETYDVPMVVGDYDADDIRAYNTGYHRRVA
jgi:hypothetical protein